MRGVQHRIEVPMRVAAMPTVHPLADSYAREKLGIGLFEIHAALAEYEAAIEIESGRNANSCRYRY